MESSLQEHYVPKKVRLCWRLSQCPIRRSGMRLLVDSLRCGLSGSSTSTMFSMPPRDVQGSLNAGPTLNSGVCMWFAAPTLAFEVELNVACCSRICTPWYDVFLFKEVGVPVNRHKRSIERPAGTVTEVVASTPIAFDTIPCRV